MFLCFIKGGNENEKLPEVALSKALIIFNKVILTEPLIHLIKTNPCDGKHKLTFLIFLNYYFFLHIS